MEYGEKMRELMHEFSVRLADCLEQKKLSTQEAGMTVMAFRKLIEEQGDVEEIKRFIQQL